MKVEIGSLTTSYGTIETGPSGLIYTPTFGESVDRLRSQVASMRWTWPDTGQRATDEELLAALPSRMVAPYGWARVIEGKAWTQREWMQRRREAQARRLEALRQEQKDPRA